MKDLLTYRYPRTMQQAFGPYTDNVLHESTQPYALHDKIILVLFAITIVGVLLTTCLE